MTIPFYTGGRNYSLVREAQAQVEGFVRPHHQRRCAMRRAMSAWRWSQIRVARASIESGKQEVRAAELAFEGVTEEAKVGARTTLDVLDAEEEVLQARADLIVAQRDEYVAGYRCSRRDRQADGGASRAGGRGAARLGGYYPGCA